MSDRHRAALGIWDARRQRTVGDRAFTIYATMLGVLVVALPVSRAIWLSVTSAAAISSLASPAAPVVAALAIDALWAAALAVGKSHGPAQLPAFLVYVLAGSDLARSTAFRRPIIRALSIVIASCGLVAATTSAALLSAGQCTLLGAVAFTGCGLLVGLISVVLWLTGQAWPRAATLAALILIGLALVAAFAASSTLTAYPWGWAAISYPTSSSLGGIALLLPLSIGLMALIPTILNQMRIEDLLSQAARWETAVTHAVNLDLSSASAVYQAKPQVGRRWRAVRRLRAASTRFFVRGLIGAARTPGRLAAGAIFIAGAGVMIALAMAPGTPSGLFGAAAGLLLFAGTGPLTDGVRHAAQVSSDFPIYGLSDTALLLAHTAMPVALTAAIGVTAAAIAAVACGYPALAPLLETLLLAVIALGARVGAALKGPLPLFLLTPVSSPLGDPMPLARLAWALDGVLLTILAGVSVAFLPNSVIGVVALMLIIATVSITRWRRRV